MHEELLFCKCIGTSFSISLNISISKFIYNYAFLRFFLYIPVVAFLALKHTSISFLLPDVTFRQDETLWREQTDTLSSTQPNMHCQCQFVEEQSVYIETHEKAI